MEIEDWGDCKVVYRHYATLYFIFIVDQQESDLGILDLIQVFVEALDKCFENVCELDIIFHSDKVSKHVTHSVMISLPRALHKYESQNTYWDNLQVNFVLDEICAAGMVLETNIVQILQAVSLGCHHPSRSPSSFLFLLSLSLFRIFLRQMPSGCLLCPLKRPNLFCLSLAPLAPICF